MSSEEREAVPDGAPHVLRVHACQRLLRWVAGSAKGWTSGCQLSGGDKLLLTLFARSTRTYEGIVRWLGERGFGEQGMMLNRSLFEDMIDAHWVSLNPDLAVERLRDHDLYSRLLRADTQRKFPAWFDGRKPPPIKVSNEERKRLRGHFGRQGSGSWTGVRDMDERVAAVLSCWPKDDSEEVLFWTAWVHKLMNEVLHPSALSLGRIGAPTVNERENFEWRFGSTSEWLTQSLHAALWTYSQTVGLVIDQYDRSSRETLTEQYAAANRDFAQAARWEATGYLDQDLEPGAGESVSPAR